MADYPSQFIHDPRPIDPPEYFERNDCIERLLIVENSWGENAPQVFCTRYFKPDCVDLESWNICISGPSHEHYWDAWVDVAANWEITQGDFKFTIEEENGNIYQLKQFITCY